MIDWDDDDTKIAAVATKEEAPKPAAAPAPAAEETPAAPTPTAAEPEPVKAAAPPADEAPESADATQAEEPAKEGDDAAATTTKEPAEPSSFAQGLAATEADAELKKREDRAKRFGITADDKPDETKKAERAKRFGVDDNAVVKGLDEALPERRPKRGREHGDDGQRGGKRQNVDSRSGRGRHNNNNNNNNRSRGGRRGGDGGDRTQTRGSGGQKSNILADPEERAKAERRAKRFGGDN